MTQPHLSLNKGDLREVIRTLDSAGSELFPQAKEVQKNPDCGASSGEAAAALASLASVVSALSERFGVLKDSAQNALDIAIEADEDVASQGQAQRRGLEG